jgi:hypothetical protein
MTGTEETDMLHPFARLVYWHAPKWVHPDDLPRLDKLCLARLCDVCYEEMGQEGDYLVLRISGETFRVRPAVLNVLPPTPYAPGDYVRTLNGTRRVGWITEVRWHGGEKRHFFHIAVEGKKVAHRRVSRRYWQEDLALVDDAEK